MRKHIIIILIFCGFTTLKLKAQTINELMNDYNNKFALEHIELFSEGIYKYKNTTGLAPFHRGIKIVNVDATWLDNISNLIEQDPTIMYPYLDNSDTQNLAAYILLSHVFNIKMPHTGKGDNLAKEQVRLNYLKRFVTDQDILDYAEKTNITSGEDLFEHMINSIWESIAIPNGVNERLKTAINNR